MTLVCLSVILNVRLLVCLSFCQPVLCSHLSVTCLLLVLSVAVMPNNCMSACRLACRSSSHAAVCESVILSVYLSICLSFCQSVVCCLACLCLYFVQVICLPVVLSSVCMLSCLSVRRSAEFLLSERNVSTCSKMFVFEWGSFRDFWKFKNKTQTNWAFSTTSKIFHTTWFQGKQRELFSNYFKKILLFRNALFCSRLLLDQNRTFVFIQMFLKPKTKGLV